jgi:hypothetical protein
MKTKQIILLLFLLLGNTVRGQYRESGDFHYQNIWNTFRTPLIGVKTNLLWDATMTANLGAEFRLSKRHTLDVPFNYNAWPAGGDARWKHLLVQPEFRWWSCESFYGHFLGLHGIWGHYNIGGVDLPFGLIPNLKNYRYQGELYGAGLSYGYQWTLSPRWSLEGTIGAGYVWLNYDKFKCGACGEKLGEEKQHYIGPTKAALSLIYIIK